MELVKAYLMQGTSPFASPGRTALKLRGICLWQKRSRSRL